MYDVIVQTGTSKETYSIDESEQVILGSGAEARLKIPSSEYDGEACELSINQDKLTVKKLGDVNLLVNGSELSDEISVPLPAELKLGETTVNVSEGTPLDISDVSSLIEELENSDLSENESLQSEISELTKDTPDEEDLKEDISEIENFLNPTEVKDKESSLNISELIDEASSAEAPAAEKVEEVKEKPKEESPLGIEFSDSEPEPEPTKPMAEQAPVKEKSSPEEKSSAAPSMADKHGFNPVKSITNQAAKNLSIQGSNPAKPKLKWRVKKSFLTKSKTPKWALLLIIVLILFLGIAYVKQQENLKELNSSRAICDLSMVLFHESILGDKAFTHIDEIDELFDSHPLRKLVDINLDFYEKNTILTDFISKYGYDLNIFYVDDGTSFIVALKPKSSFTRLIFPLDSYYINSSEMVLRKMKEGHPKLADEAFFKVISKDEAKSWENSAKSFPVKKWDYSAEDVGYGFFTPDELFNNFDNYTPRVYNYPRYYKASNKAFSYISKLINSLSNPQLTLSATKYFHKLDKFPSYTLYSQSSVQHLTNMRSELSRYGTYFQSFILASVSVDESTGSIEKVSLLEDSITNYLSYRQIQSDNNDSKLGKLEANAQVAFANHIKSIAEDFTTATLPLKNRLVEIISDPKEVVSAAYPTIVKQAVENFLEDREQIISPLQKRVSVLYDTYVVKNKSISEKHFFKAIEDLGLAILIPEELRIQAAEFSSNKIYDPNLSNEINIGLKALQSSLNLDDMLVISKKLAQLIKENNFVSTEQYSIFKKRFQTLVLNQAELHFRESIEENKTAPNLRMHQPKLVALFQTASINPEIQKQFFNEIFDSVSEEISNIPHQSYSALLSNKAVSNAVESSESHKKISNALNKLSSAASQLPLTVVPGTSEEKELLDISRIGKQVYLHASNMPASIKKNRELKDAISLMKEGLGINRNLWLDILDARSSIINYPSVEIDKAINTSLGFSALNGNILMQIQTTLTNYNESKQKVITQLNPDSNSNQRGVSQEVRSFLFPVLNKIEDLISQGTKQSNSLKKYYQMYTSELETFYKDYVEAKSQGFFKINRGYQTKQFSKLKQKLDNAMKLEAKLASALNRFNKIISSYEKLVKDEQLSLNRLESLEGSNPSTEELKQPVYQGFNEVSLGRQIKDNLEIVILPVP